MCVIIKIINIDSSWKALERLFQTRNFCSFPWLIYSRLSLLCSPTFETYSKRIAAIKTPFNPFFSFDLWGEEGEDRAHAHARTHTQTNRTLSLTQFCWRQFSSEKRGWLNSLRHTSEGNNWTCALDAERRATVNSSLLVCVTSLRLLSAAVTQKP